MAIEYGKPVWKEEYEKGFDELTSGNRWRMGQNHWSTPDTRFPITIGGTRIERGIHYVVLERSAGDEWHLVLLNPDALSDLKMDAWHVNRKESPKGISAPLAWRRVEQKADHLRIQFLIDEADQRKGRVGDPLRSAPAQRPGPCHVRRPAGGQLRKGLRGTMSRRIP